MTIKQVLVPDIGNFKDVEIIEVLVQAGDSVGAEDALVTLETDKATMDVPSPFAGVVKELKVKTGDKVSEGSLIALVEVSEAATAPAAPTPSPLVGEGGERGRAVAAPTAPSPQPSPTRGEGAVRQAPPTAAMMQPASSGPAHASPSI
ncbi:MAG: branched-chain alpha-keto acid dehydrogenase subunit E2, partial [Gallionellaceae bacterium]|nr:branched-chain alpha-keto acid dehydrogenase subunit E2 [Gallionellaceae bacterium]